MKLKIFLSLFVISTMIFISSCGEDEKQAELEKVDSIDELIEDMDSAKDNNMAIDTISISPAPEEPAPTDQNTNNEAVNQVEQTTSNDYSKKPLQGTVVSFDDLMIGGSGKVNKQKALDLVSKGNMIVLKTVDGRLFFVYNEDGSFAGKRLAGFANNDKVGLIGKAKVVDGLNIFIMNLIEAM